MVLVRGYLEGICIVNRGYSGLASGTHKEEGLQIVQTFIYCNLTDGNLEPPR